MNEEQYDQLWRAAMLVKPEPLEWDGVKVLPCAFGVIDIQGATVTATIQWRYVHRQFGEDGYTQGNFSLDYDDWDCQLREGTDLPIRFLKSWDGAGLNWPPTEKVKDA